MTTPPILSGREIAVAALATRAVLDEVLADEDVTFESWAVVNLLGDRDLPVAEIVDVLVLNLRIDEPAALAIVATTRAEGRTTGDEVLSLTDAGRALLDRVRPTVAGLVDRLYGDLPEEDLRTTRRVLETVTERARAELAA